MTAIFIAYSLRVYWRARKSVSFWCIFLSFLAVHLLGVGHLWTAYNGLSTFEVGLVGGAEFLSMAFVIYLALCVSPDMRRHSAKFDPQLEGCSYLTMGRGCCAGY
jgi:hypothetical protein